MTHRKRYSQAEQEMVIGMYRESGQTLRDFCEGEGLEVGRLERWLKHQEKRQGATIGGRGQFLEVVASQASSASRGEGKYRLGFADGGWLEVGGGFEAESVRTLVAIMKEQR